MYVLASLLSVLLLFVFVFVFACCCVLCSEVYLCLVFYECIYVLDASGMGDLDQVCPARGKCLVFYECIHVLNASGMEEREIRFAQHEGTAILWACTDVAARAQRVPNNFHSQSITPSSAPHVFTGRLAWKLRAPEVAF